MLRFFAIILPAAIMSLVFPAVAFAQATTEIPTSITQTSSPFAITSCRVTKDWAAHVAFNIVNRSRFDLLNFKIRVTFYDTAGQAMGQTDLYFQPNDAITTGDTGSYSSIMNGYNEPLSALGRTKCRPESATLAGHHRWSYGHKWVGALTPIHRMPISNASTSVNTRNSFASNSSPTNVKVRVVKTWSDNVNGTLYVHDQIEATAPAGRK